MLRARIPSVDGVQAFEHLRRVIKGIPQVQYALQQALFSPPSAQKVDVLITDLRRVLADWRFDKSMKPKAKADGTGAAAAAAKGKGKGKKGKKGKGNGQAHAADGGGGGGGGGQGGAQQGAAKECKHCGRTHPPP